MAEYSPLTTVELEICLSYLNSNLTDRRLSSTEENIYNFILLNSINFCTHFTIYLIQYY